MGATSSSNQRTRGESRWRVPSNGLYMGRTTASPRSVRTPDQQLPEAAVLSFSKRATPPCEFLSLLSLAHPVWKMSRPHLAHISPSESQHSRRLLTVEKKRNKRKRSVERCDTGVATQHPRIASTQGPPASLLTSLNASRSSTCTYINLQRLERSHVAERRIACSKEGSRNRSAARDCLHVEEKIGGELLILIAHEESL